MPTERAIRRWIADESQPLSHLYARAHELAFYKMADDLITLADSATVENEKIVKLQIETRKWLLSKRVPKTFGDKAHLQVEAKMEVRHELPTDDELARMLAAAIAEAEAPILLESHSVSDTGPA